jgi:hypothetical protein
MSANKLAEKAGRAAISKGRMGWRLVVKIGEKKAEVRQWEVQVYPPGAGEPFVSVFETLVDWKKEDWARGLLACMERLLGAVAPDGPFVVQREADWRLF